MVTCQFNVHLDGVFKDSLHHEQKVEHGAFQDFKVLDLFAYITKVRDLVTVFSLQIAIPIFEPTIDKIY